MQAEIITIGDEILIGQIVDTNSAWLGKTLNAEGVDVHCIRSIRDEPGEIHKALVALDTNTQIVFLTGGLGPTRDDKTKQALADFFGVQMVQHDAVERHIEALFAKFKREVNRLNRSQALLPENCIPLFNEMGTAPGMLFEWENRLVFSLPGVPYEMKHLVLEKALPEIKKRRSRIQEIVHLTLLTQGVPESILAEQLTEFENTLPEDIKLAYLPSAGRVRLRLTGKAPQGRDIEARVEEHFDVLRQALLSITYGEGDVELEEVVGQLLLAGSKTVGVAESCTGGYISHLLTSIPGSSAYFQGSILSYSNHLKQKLLNVSSADLMNYGAVSDVVVKQMASAASEVLGTDYALSTSGVAGPSGGSPEKPVGLVWIGLKTPKELKAFQFQFSGDRERIIRKSALMALDILRRALVKDE
jgi:nicotinamide-nucleotide amidase